MMQDIQSISKDELNGESLEVRYIPVTRVQKWEKNPKQHDIGAIIESIEKNGFRDPPSYDETLGALIEGNGRATSLVMMMQQNYDVPRGILTHKETGEWYMPVNFGINADTMNAAIAYAIDHNNLTMAGGDFTVFDFVRMWNTDQFTELLTGFNPDEMPVTIDIDDLQVIMDDGFEFDDDLDTYAEDEVDLGDDDPYAPKIITLNVIEHGIVDDVVLAIQNAIDENAWNEVITLETPEA